MLDYPTGVLKLMTQDPKLIENNSNARMQPNQHFVFGNYLLTFKNFVSVFYLLSKMTQSSPLNENIKVNQSNCPFTMKNNKIAKQQNIGKYS